MNSCLTAKTGGNIKNEVVSVARILVLSSSLEVLELAIAFVFHPPRPRRLSIQVQPVAVSSVETRSKRNRGFSSHVRMRAIMRLARFFLHTWSRVEHVNMGFCPDRAGTKARSNWACYWLRQGPRPSLSAARDG